MNLSNHRWNQGNLELNPFTPTRKRAAHQVRIEAQVADLFKRACLADLPGWLPSGAVCLSGNGQGKHALWSESETASLVLQQPGRQTFWTITRLEAEHFHCQAVLLDPDLAIGTLDISMEGQEGSTVVRFDLAYTVLSEAGSDLFDQGIEGRLARLLQRFGDTLTRLLDAAPTTPAGALSYQPQHPCAEHEITINGNIDECFALACPVAELLWIDDWKFDLIYSESGKNETGCTFLEPSSGLSMLRSVNTNTYWYTTRYDTEQHRFDAVWLSRDLSIAHWQVRMTDLGEGQTRTTWRLGYTALGHEGNRILGEPGMEARMKRGLRFITTSLKHYVETGKIYRLSGQRKLQVAAALIGAALGRHLRRLRSGGRAELSPAP
jgi:hypothetical protein